MNQIVDLTRLLTLIHFSPSILVSKPDVRPLVSSYTEPWPDRQRGFSEASFKPSLMVGPLLHSATRLCRLPDAGMLTMSGPQGSPLATFSAPRPRRETFQNTSKVPRAALLLLSLLHRRDFFRFFGEQRDQERLFLFIPRFAGASVRSSHPAHH